MTKHFVNSLVKIRTTITVNGVKTDPTTVVFVWRVNPLKETTVTTATKLDTGIYQVEITPEDHGNLVGYWRTTGPITQNSPVEISIHAVERILQ